MESDSSLTPGRDSARQAAQRYLERGWSVIPVPHRSKNPGFKRWEQMRLTCAELDQHFNGRPQNISVLLGEPSGWLIDVDLDHRRAVELAPQFLPPTALVFGRSGKPRSHWLYRVTAPLVTKKFSSRSSGMIVEVRSTGTHTVFPPSVHEMGEPITWDDEQQLPAEVEPELLLENRGPASWFSPPREPCRPPSRSSGIFACTPTAARSIVMRQHAQRVAR